MLEIHFYCDDCGKEIWPCDKKENPVTVDELIYRIKRNQMGGCVCSDCLLKKMKNIKWLDANWDDEN